MLWLLSALGFDAGQPQVQAGLLNFFGVLVTGGIAVVTWFLSQNKDRTKADSLREERKRDLRLALWSDILPIWIGLFRLGTPEDKIAAVNAAFDQARDRGDREFTPFAMPAAEPLFSAKLVDDVALLDSQEIEPIVQFYHQLARMNQLALNMRERGYAALPLERKRKPLLELTQLEIQVEDDALKALKALEKTMPPLSNDQPTIEIRLRRETVKREEARNARQKNRLGS